METRAYYSPIEANQERFKSPELFRASIGFDFIFYREGGERKIAPEFPTFIN